MLVMAGQFLVGKTTENGPSEVYAVKSISKLRSGDRKAWLVRWEPQDEGDGLVVEVQVRFPGGEIADPWRILDLYDAPAMLERVEKALAIHTALAPGLLTQSALKVMQSAFRGPSGTT